MTPDLLTTVCANTLSNPREEAPAQPNVITTGTTERNAIALREGKRPSFISNRWSIILLDIFIGIAIIIRAKSSTITRDSPEKTSDTTAMFTPGDFQLKLRSRENTMPQCVASLHHSVLALQAASSDDAAAAAASGRRALLAHGKLSQIN